MTEKSQRLNHCVLGGDGGGISFLALDPLQIRRTHVSQGRMESKERGICGEWELCLVEPRGELERPGGYPSEKNENQSLCSGSVMPQSRDLSRTP